MENATTITTQSTTGANTKRKGNRTAIIAIAVIAVIAAVIAFRLASNKKEINQAAQAPVEAVVAIPVRITSVQQQALDNSQSFTGTFGARQELPLTAEAQGSITSLNIKEGDRVGQGRVIATIDATTIQSNLRTAQIQYNKAVQDAARYKRLADAAIIVALESMKLPK